MSKKISVVILSVCIAIFISCGAVFAAAHLLPDIKGWRNGETKGAKLNGETGAHGVWVERTYRRPDGLTFQAILADGDGSKVWDIAHLVSNGDIKADGYAAKKLTVSGRNAVFEVRPDLGVSLIVAVDKQTVLTLESYCVEAEDLTDAAEVLINAMEKKD